MTKKTCTMCREAKPVALFGAYSAKKDGLRPQCKACMSAHRAAYRKTEHGAQKHRDQENARYARNPEPIKKRSAANHIANRDKALEYKKKVYYAAKESDPEFRKRENTRIREYEKKFPWKRSAIVKKRKGKNINATPKWLTKSQKDEIKNFYKESFRLSKETGNKYHVDHIIPLVGKNISGLHVPWNLQIITAIENCSKGNKVLV